MNQYQAKYENIKSRRIVGRERVRYLALAVGIWLLSSFCLISAFVLPAILVYEFFSGSAKLWVQAAWIIAALLAFGLFIYAFWKLSAYRARYFQFFSSGVRNENV